MKWPATEAAGHPSRASQGVNAARDPGNEEVGHPWPRNGHPWACPRSTVNDQARGGLCISADSVCFLLKLRATLRSLPEIPILNQARRSDAALAGGYPVASLMIARPNAPVAQLDRVAASEAAGRWFESSRARHNYRRITSPVEVMRTHVQPPSLHTRLSSVPGSARL